MRGRNGSSICASPSTSIVTSARSARSASFSRTSTRIGSARVVPSDTTIFPVSSSLRKSTSSMSSRTCSPRRRNHPRRARRGAPASPRSAPCLSHRRSPLVHQTATKAVPLLDEPTTMVARMSRVLIVEDDEVIGQSIARHLGAAGFDPVLVDNGKQGLARLRFEQPDVCVVDLMLPQVDGWKLIEQVRSEGIGTPIVVVSARGTEHDRIHALEIGADDYLVKPFSMKELVARVKAAARRGVRAQEQRRGDAIEIEE